MMRIKTDLKSLFFIAIVLFNDSIWSKDEDGIDVVKCIKNFSDNFQKTVKGLIDKTQEKEDNLNFFNFLKTSKKDYEKNIENFSKDSYILGKEFSIKTFQKLHDFVENKVNLFLSINSENTIEYDKIGWISAGVTILIVAALRKKSSLAQKVVTPIFFSFLVYNLVSKNKDIKEIINKK